MTEEALPAAPVSFDGERVPDPREGVPLRPDAAERTARWFRPAGLGLFIHWDHASVQGLETSWPLLRSPKESPRAGHHTRHVADYHASATRFDPTAWDPQELARLAKRAGAKYGVFTTRHHSGWCAWPSKTSDRTIASSPYGERGGDIVREFVDAFRAEGLKIGFYYSLPDWGHESYPPFTDEMRPYRHFDYPRPSEADWNDYLDYVKAQLTELIEWYSPDMLWFDGEWERSPEEWRVDEIASVISGLDDSILVSDRLVGHGDFATPEQYVPSEPRTEPWECCMTISESWSWVPSDERPKSVVEIIRTLSEVRWAGGNLLLNVGPKDDGSIPEAQRAVLEGLADWMRVNRAAIEGTLPGLPPGSFAGATTRSADGSRVYLICTSLPVEHAIVRGVRVRRVKRATLLATGDSLDFTFRTPLHDIFLPDPLGELSIRVPSTIGTLTTPVIEVEFEGETDGGR